jgi:sugar/nucleoside kinase (ribokinase family)
MSLEAIIAGHLCLDIIPALPAGAQFIPGRMVEAGAALFATGGAVSNTGLALHTLGVRVSLAGRTGDDLFGHAVRAIIEGHGAGLTDGIGIAPGDSTSYTIILSPPGADRTFIHHPGSNARFGAADVAEAHLAEARILHFGYPPLMERIYRERGAELLLLLERAKRAGAATSLDMTMIDLNGATGHVDWRAILERVLPATDLFLPSIEEMLQMLDPARYRRLAAAGDVLDLIPAAEVAALGRELLALGPALVAIKCGHRGMYVCSAGVERFPAMGRGAPADPRAWAEREVWAPCYATRVVGTTGAGDATIAGLIMGLLRGFDLAGALRAASAVGACCVEAPDAVSGVRNWPETEARIAAGWERLPLSVDIAGWRWDAAQEVWRGSHDECAGRE